MRISCISQLKFVEILENSLFQKREFSVDSKKNCQRRTFSSSYLFFTCHLFTLMDVPSSVRSLSNNNLQELPRDLFNQLDILTDL